MNPYLLVIVGPTAVGKTAVALRVAQHYGTEIISADARQCYQRTTIGTAKPSAKEQARVRHHLVDFLPVAQSYDARQFEQDALQAVATIHQRHPLAVVVGGSGLYVQTLCDGIDEVPDVPPAVRQALNERWQQAGLVPLIDELRRVDPDYYAVVDRRNPRRVIRALEVYRSTGTPYSVFRRGRVAPPRPFRSIRVGLTLPREQLYERINRRVDRMVEQGLPEEVRSLYPWRHEQALRTVGYRELFPVLEGQYDLAEGIRLVKRNTRRYAKRQLTWFGRDARTVWFDTTDGTEAAARRIIAYVDATRRSDA